MKKDLCILLVFLFLLPMLCLPASAEGADFVYTAQLTSEGTEVTDLTALPENTRVDLQLDLYRRDVSGSHDIWGVQFSVIVDGMEQIPDTYESNFPAITNTCFQSPLDTSYTDNYVWMDLGQNPLTAENPLTLRHSYRITDPFKASVRVSYVYVLPKDSKGVTPTPIDPKLNNDISVELDKHELTLTVGDTDKLIETVLPEDALNKNVVWSSGDESIAKVDQNGCVTAISKGTVMITVKTVCCGKRDSAIVNVIEDETTYSDETASPDETVSPDETSSADATNPSTDPITPAPQDPMNHCGCCMCRYMWIVTAALLSIDLILLIIILIVLIRRKKGSDESKNIEDG